MTRAGGGVFVVIEGPEGAGKSTLAAGLAGRMREAGVEPVVVREPGGTHVAEAIRGELLDPQRRWTAERELLYFTTARADLVERVIRPALEAGRLVISDRYELSTEAYQVGGRGLPLDQVRQFNLAATGGLRPDLLLILDVAPETGQRRQLSAGKVQDRLDRESAEFHQRVRAYYLAATGPAIRHLDATQSAEQVLHEAWTEICARCSGNIPGLERLT